MIAVVSGEGRGHYKKGRKKAVTESSRWWHRNPGEQWAVSSQTPYISLVLQLKNNSHGFHGLVLPSWEMAQTLESLSCRCLSGTCTLKAASKNFFFPPLTERLESSRGWLQRMRSEKKHVYQGVPAWKYLKPLCVYHIVQKIKEASRRISQTSIKMTVLGRKHCSPFADEEEAVKGLPKATLLLMVRARF